MRLNPTGDAFIGGEPFRSTPLRPAQLAEVASFPSNQEVGRMKSLPSIFFRRAAGLVVAMFATSLAAHAQQGRVAVRVTDVGTQQPVAQAQVQIVGTTLGGLTGPEGRFTIRGVPPGTHQVRVLRVGYGEQKKQVTVAADQEATVDFTISAVAISLTPVVTTATGEQRRVEQGNSIASLAASKIAQDAPTRAAE